MWDDENKDADTYFGSAGIKQFIVFLQKSEQAIPKHFLELIWLQRDLDQEHWNIISMISSNKLVYRFLDRKHGKTWIEIENF